MFLFAIAIAIATFIENDYGTTTARALVFNSWWLELILIFLCSIFIYNIFEYRLFHINKLPVLFLHLSFIFIIIGAGITRYISNEGVMRIREGTLNNQFISTNLFLEYKIHNSISQYSGQKELILSSKSNNSFSIPMSFDNKNIKIQYVNFIHDPVEELVDSQEGGGEIIELIIPSESGGMQSEYILKNSQKYIKNLNVNYQSNLKTDLNIYQEDSLFYFDSKFDVHFMKMSDRSTGVLMNNSSHLLNNKVLYTIDSQNIVFKNYFQNAILKQVPANIKNDAAKLDLLKIILTVANQDTIIDLYGAEGVLSSKNYFQFNDLYFSLSYGPRVHTLPFGIFLKDFQLERYPGSESPSSFASEIQIMDGTENIDYRIFMNNVLNYKGYRFFQSSYDNDEKGTILSVNQDRLGTGVTYFGYFSLLCSVLSLLISRFSRISILGKQHKTV
tara:strand:+ start:9951 stop:11285 length:1335 start_codon:yes stop_codon:yes gene_type:complete